MRTLQRLIIPALDVCAEVGLYLRLAGAATLDVEERQVAMRAGGVLRTDTFFGVFSLGTWSQKSTVEQIVVRLDVSGTFTLETIVTDLDGNERAIDRRQVESGSSVVGAPVARRARRVVCCGSVSPVSRRRAGFGPSRSPPRTSQLARSISVWRSRRSTACRTSPPTSPGSAGSSRSSRSIAEDVSVIIVDNASNLELSVHGSLPVEIVSNPNLGGAGGFARGLWEHRRRGQATHVLFMDDDIAFEPEVIARTVAFLRFAVDDDVCVAGSMMRMDQPAVQFEAGADCDPTARHLWDALGRSQNLLYTSVLLDNERLEPFDYGAWWYYAFPLDHHRGLPASAVRAR